MTLRKTPFNRQILKTISQNIGLGDARKINRLEVYWPTTGETQQWTEVPLNSFLQITEGEDQLQLVSTEEIDLWGHWLSGSSYNPPRQIPVSGWVENMVFSEIGSSKDRKLLHCFLPPTKSKSKTAVRWTNHTAKSWYSLHYGIVKWPLIMWISSIRMLTLPIPFQLQFPHGIQAE